MGVINGEMTCFSSTYKLAFLQQNHIISVNLRLIMCIIEPTKSRAVHYHVPQQRGQYSFLWAFPIYEHTDTAPPDLNSNSNASIEPKDALSNAPSISRSTLPSIF
jgi:hypothetical protein